MDKTSFAPAADGTQIWYGITGSGPPVVLCDGLACDGFIWPYLIDELVDRYTVIRWHYRGHGLSDDPTDLETLDIAHLADDLRVVLEAIAIDSAVLVGHSMGVQVLLEFYDRHPERVDALIPICGNYKRPLDTFFNTDLLARALPYLHELVESVPDAAQSAWRSFVPSQLGYFLATTAAVNMRLARGVDFRPYLEHVADMNLRVFLALLDAVGQHSAEHVLSKIDVPTLVIAGENDDMTPLFRSREMAEQIADARLKVISGGTHVGPIELPDLINGAIVQFLDKTIRLRPN